MMMVTSLKEEQVHIAAQFLLKLQGLSIKATIHKVEEGPVVTGYYLKPDSAQPIGKILRHKEDFALAAQVNDVTITREKGDIVIFVPNKERKIVDFKEVLQWICTNEVPRRMRIPIPLGVNHLGEKAALDLLEQPHVLIAGQTGSGKSVLECAIIATLAVSRTPKELQMILVDTKALDLPLFEQVPHVRTVVKTLEDFRKMMRSLFFEYELRKTKLESAKCRNLTEYNSFVGEANALPYIVLLIDEFADLIDRDKFERKEGKNEDLPSVPEYVKKLIQVSRATGIHSIICTQRSSVKVISGDIKANLPCRIALALPTRDDSKTILGEMGAESLLGKGDMLIQRNDNDSLERFHGPFVKLDDIAYVICNSDMLRDMFQNMTTSKANAIQ